MECNKEEAVRAKELAEKKMDSKDYVGARMMVFKAQKLYPSIENVSQMLTVCEVHCSAEHKVVGSEPDWYGILQIEQTADEASIKKQFRKLALQLHPDKNKFPGAEAAFKLIGEAQRFLCDQSKRSQFDQKRKTMRPGQQRQSQNQPSRNNYPSKQHSNPVATGTAAQFARMNPHQQKQQTQPSYANGQQTFWTACPFCSIRYQYYRDIMNRALRCQSCMKPFIAYDLNNQGIPPGVNNQPMPQKKEAPSQNGQKFTSVNLQGNRGNVPPVPQPPTMTGRDTAAGRAPKPYAKEDVNVHVEAGMKTEPKPLGTKNRKRGRKSDSEEESDSSENESSCDMEEDGDHKSGQNPGLNSGRDTRRSSRQKHDVSYKENLSDDDDVASGSRRETTKMNEPVDKDKRKVLEESTPDGNAENCKNNGEEVAEDDGNHEGSEPTVLEVADPDFYDFDRDKSEECFAVDQMWAIFDDLDGMPRFYARINKVYSPFKVDITWLEFVAGDPGETAWKRSGLPVACGKFKHEKSDTIEDVGTFSHKIVWEKGVRNTYKIYPRKGETWALYKNWNIKWSSDPDNHSEYEYEFVVVQSDYTNESGILVAQLVKLKGFVCLFKPTKTNGMSSFQIPSNQMLRFSHRVPSFRTNGRERKDVPEGYFELDPASLPSNLEEVSDHIDGKAETVGGEINGSLKSVLEEKPHMPKNDVTAKAESNMPKNGVTAKAESMTPGTSDGVTAKAERAPEQTPSSPTIDPQELPESVFYSFEDDKTEEKLQAGQVWALYCELDGLPKYYGLIKKVESTPEFKVNIQWLEACTPPRGLLQWLDSKMPTCCGVFSSGDEMEFDDTASFSHLSKGAAPVKKNNYEIYPRKGEVWAIYRNLSSEWSSSDLQTCEYDIGKVVNVEGTMKVLVLETVSGYDTIFKGQMKAGCESILEIPRRELLRFSHQIPAIQLTDDKVRTLLTDEKVGTLPGCWELDPKAMPICLFNCK
ncbi:uncharacterized protein LOC113349276 [Papaver somniferum]|uniref:uncharacterized protein LOC113349276 n=1 Tax=Papaver somniferum TaxID=3469 RepID=UPI000E6F9230|nr:uncharacterized protein LOC113349276 [Papaver somniferum]